MTKLFYTVLDDKPRVLFLWVLSRKIMSWALGHADGAMTTQEQVKFSRGVGIPAESPDTAAGPFDRVREAGGCKFLSGNRVSKVPPSTV